MDASQSSPQNSDSKALISLRELSKVFTRGGESIRAIDNLSLRIDRGEFVAITGASGSGKSTLMYILGLLDKETSGDYLLFERSTKTLTDTERAALRNVKFGFVFQGFHLLPRASALRNVSMPLEYTANYGTRISSQEITERATETLIRVGLGDRLHHRPNELSGGQRQRVAVARALINNPSVLFADEPTGNLDSRNANEILDLFKSLHADQRSVVLVTHDPTLAAEAIRRIKMHDGRVVEDISK